MTRNLILLLVAVYVLSRIFSEYRGRQNKRKKKEGDVSISGTSRKTPASQDPGGEYVEYEEIKDEKK